MTWTELMLVVGLWAIWMGALLAGLHGIGREAARPDRRAPQRPVPPRGREPRLS